MIDQLFDDGVWAIHDAYIDQLKANVEAATRNREALIEKKKRAEYESMFTLENGTATVPMVGPVFPRENLFTRLMGGIVTEDMTGLMKHLDASDDVKRVVMLMDSPGGKVPGLSNLAGQIRRMETPTATYVQGNMYSAAYWIGSAADKIYASPTSGVGSIGVIATITSKSRRLEDEGMDVEVIRSVPDKAVVNSMEPISEKAVNTMKRRVNAIHAQFVQEVATNRNISIEAAQEMGDGKDYMAKEVEDTDFLDAVKSLEDVYAEYDMDGAEGETETALTALTEAFSDQKDVLEAAVQQIRDQRDVIESLKSDLDNQQAESKAAKIDAVVEQAIQADKKFSPAKADFLKARLEKDFEATVEMIDAVSKGAAAPDAPLETDNEDSPDVEAEKRISHVEATQGIYMVYDEEDGAAERERLFQSMGKSEGEDYFLASKIMDYDLDVK